MLFWLPRRRAGIEKIDAEADAMVHDLGVAAYGEARRREHEASSDATARYWSRVALAVARMIGRHIDVDTLTRIAMNAVFVPDREPAASREPRSLSKHQPQTKRRTSVPPRRIRFESNLSALRQIADSIIDGSRDSCDGRVGGNRRRREYRVAASNDRIVHSRR